MSRVSTSQPPPTHAWNTDENGPYRPQPELQGVNLDNAAPPIWLSKGVTFDNVPPIWLSKG